VHLPELELRLRQTKRRSGAALGHFKLNGCSDVFLLLEQLFQSAHHGFLLKQTRATVAGFES
jgi:hypothetical protein